MFCNVRKKLSSGKIQLDILSLFLLVLLILSALNIARTYSWYSIFPLVAIGYAIFRVVFEQTWNRHNVPTLATGFIGRRKMAEVLRQMGVTSSSRPYTIIDLGSGRGELSRFLARHIPGSHIIGIEIARWPHTQAVFMQRWFGPSNITYECGDFETYSCGQIDAVVMYLSGKVTRHVGEKLQRELRPGSIVIAHTFELGGTWVPTKVINFRTPFKEIIYVYRKA